MCVLWLGLAFLLSFVVLAKLLLAHSPILDLGDRDGKQSCEPSDRRARSASVTIRKFHSSESCPDPYLLADARTEGSAESWTTFRKALESYKAFHKEKLKQLKQEAARGAEVKVRTLTWSCSQGKMLWYG